MIENILAVTCTVVEFSEKFDNVGMKTGDACFEFRAFAFTLDDLVDIAPCFFNGVLDPCGMDPSVINKFLKREPCDFSADRVEAADRNGFGGVVDDEVDSRRRFEGADISALAADYAAFHLIVRDRYYRDRGFTRMFGSASRYSNTDNVFCKTVLIFSQALLVSFDLKSLFMVELVVETLEKLFFRFRLSESGYLLEFFKFAFLQ